VRFFWELKGEVKLEAVGEQTVAGKVAFRRLLILVEVNL
jgi:hypothetical protein